MKHYGNSRSMKLTRSEIGDVLSNKNNHKLRLILDI